MVRVIGIDPAIASLGFAIVDINQHSREAIFYGVIATPASESVGDRLLVIKQDMDSLIKEYQPERAVIERPIFAQANTNAAKVLRACGVVELAFAEHRIPYQEPTQSQWRAQVIGSGKADKHDSKFHAENEFGIELTQPDDAWDALCIALYEN